MASQLLFFIVGKNDNPIYQADFTSQSKSDDTAHLNEFIVHSALDLVDEAAQTSRDMNLKVVDSFNDSNVSAFVTAGHVRFMMLHRTRIDEPLKNFFAEVYELYIKVVMNPFYQLNNPITSPVFDQNVRLLAKRYFNV